jgi:ribosomal protein S18 acetylase RimI-like enzyme
MISIKKVDKTAIPIIQELANITWHITYREILSAEQINYMLDLFYSEASLKKQIEHNHQFIVASENNNAVGFASYAPKGKGDTKTYVLHKIYVDPEMHGIGIGQLLIGHIINDIEILGFTNLQLNVNRNNKSVQFYQKLGFEIIREEDIDIGNGYFMNDYVMLKKI